MVFVPSCGHWSCCAEGRPALCEPGLKHNTNGSLLSGAKRISVNGEVINHHLGFLLSDYAVSHRRVKTWALISIQPFKPSLVVLY